MTIIIYILNLLTTFFLGIGVGLLVARWRFQKGLDNLHQELDTFLQESINRVNLELQELENKRPGHYKSVKKLN